MGKFNTKNKPTQSGKTIIGKPNKKDSSTNKVPIKKEKLFDKPTSSNRVNKKNKFKNNRKDLINKIKLSNKQVLLDNKRKRKEKTAITGDFKQLKDALPSLDQLLKLPRSAIKTGIKNFDDKDKLMTETKLDKSNRRKEFMNRYKCFTSLLNDQFYKNNPRDTIAKHMENSIIDN